MPKNSVRDWDTTSTANTDVGGTGINEGCDPGNINDAIRKVMAQTAEWFGDTNGSLVSGGSASAYTLTTNEGVTAYAQGMTFLFEANHASTGASTLAVDGLAAKAIKKRNDVALAAGDIESGQMVLVAYEAAADAFQMLSQTAAGPSGAMSGDLDLNGFSIIGLTTVPSGSVSWFAANSPPTGWLECDGSAVSRSTYANLFSAISTTFGSGDGSTTFNLPDLRGEFIRGWDNGKGTDSGRAFGSTQLDQMQQITGSANDFTASAAGVASSGALSLSVPGATAEGGANFRNRLKLDFDSANSPGARTGTETRSRNIALLPIIKY